MQPVFLIDAGNTSIKGALYANGDLQRTFRADTHDDVAALWGHLDEWPETPSAVVLASVVKGLAEKLQAGVEERWQLDLTVAWAEMPVGVRVEVPRPETVGIDRLLMSGEAYVRSGAAAIVVGVGTAITVDVVDQDGTYVGGTISPGMRTSTWALASRASLLPEVDIDEPEGPDIPSSTTDSIRSGVLVGTAGSVDRLVSELAGRANLESHSVILSGGDGARLSPYLETQHTLAEDLVIWGLAHTYERYLESGGH
jgi:type III pantothenate kinase